jgi:hypothetical protein
MIVPERRHESSELFTAKIAKDRSIRSEPIEKRAGGLGIV